MKEEFFAVLISFVMSFFLWLFNYLKIKSTERRLDDLRTFISSLSDVFYFLCPKCGAEIDLNDIDIKERDIDD